MSIIEKIVSAITSNMNNSGLSEAHSAELHSEAAHLMDDMNLRIDYLQYAGC